MEIVIKGKRLRKRRAAIALIVLMLVGTLIATTFNLVNASEPVPEANKQVIANTSLNEIEIVVKSGDTAWEIQQRLTPKGNMENMMDKLNEINDKDVSNIQEGEAVKFIQIAK